MLPNQTYCVLDDRNGIKCLVNLNQKIELVLTVAVTVVLDDLAEGQVSVTVPIFRTRNNQVVKIFQVSGF